MRALITGITGQDGSYLAELLLNKGYQVYGIKSPRTNSNFSNIQHLLADIQLVTADLCDQSSLEHVFKVSQPHEIYNLAALSFVQNSWNTPEQTTNVNGLGVIKLLEIMRTHCPDSKFFQASSSELFGNPISSPQNEQSFFRPRNPYGIAKLFAHWSAINYRQKYGLFVSCGILFNHESIRRGDLFVTKKIATAAAKIKQGLQSELLLGNLEARRDMGHAEDFVRAMWLMLQEDTPTDYVIATGQTHSVRDILEIAFSRVDLDWRHFVKQSDEFIFPTEDEILVGDTKKISERLNWKPNYIFKDIIEEMVDHELRATRRT